MSWEKQYHDTVKKFEGFEKDLEGFRNFARNQSTQQEETVRLIASLREELDKERSKVKRLELGMDQVVAAVKRVQSNNSY